jgi:sugar/nucleoside kinase (ribokinase family)
MKKIDICGIGNGIVDILLKVSEEEFAAFGLEKGVTTLVGDQDQRALLAKLPERKQVLVSGGSVANSLIAASQLGGRSALITCLGSDLYGNHYKQEFDDLEIVLANELIDGGRTGTCLVLITPDAERTMQTNLGISSRISEQSIDEEIIQAAAWLYIEGYVIGNPEYGIGAVRRAIEYAEQHGCKIAVTFSDLFIVEGFRETLKEIVRRVDLVFANQAEATAYAGVASIEDAVSVLAEEGCDSVVTAGAEGAYINYCGERFFSPAFQCEPVDLTGAGDMFAGTFLYGVTHQVDVRLAAKAAGYLAMKVISKVGARLESGVEDFWKEAIDS